jgi:hypothetical protein
MKSGLPKSFWGEAAHTANHVRNYSPCASCEDQVPIALWNGTLPSISYFKVFGCTAYATIPKVDREWKFGERGKKAIFVGYPDNHRGYKLWDTTKDQPFYSRDVKFNENYFGWYGKKEENVGKENRDSRYVNFEVDEMVMENNVERPLEKIGESLEQSNQETTLSEIEEVEVESGEDESSNDEDNSSSETQEEDEDVVLENNDELEDLRNQRRILRPRTENIKPSKYSAMVELNGQDIICNNSDDCMYYFSPYPGVRFN